MKAGWPHKKISEVAVHSLGKMLDRAKNIGEPRPYLRNLNVRWFDFDLSDVREMRFRAEEQSKYTISKGDLVICEGGYPGRAAIWEDNDPIHFQKALHRVRFHEPERAKWCLYYLHWQDLNGTLKKRFSGAGIQHFTGEALANFEMPIPSLPEQRRIVGILDEAFAGVEVMRANAEKNLQNARTLFENHLNAVFTQRGDGWVEGSLGKIGGRVFTGPFGSLLHKSDYVRGGTPLVNPAHIVDGAIVPDQEKAVDLAALARLRAYQLQPGDIVVARRGEIGRCAIVTENESGWLCGTGCFFVRVSNGTDPSFLAHLLRTTVYREQLESSSSGTTMQNLSNTALSDFQIRLPPFEKQQATMTQIDLLSLQIKHLDSLYRQKLDALDALKKSLLHHAFTGQL